MSNGTPNAWKSQLWYPYTSDTFKMILMDTDFVFDPDSHDTYADVSASELATGNGYTAGGITLSNFALTTNDTDNRSEVTFDNVTWTASGGPIATSGGIIYMTSTAGGIYELTNPIVSYKDAGGTITAVDGTPVIISSIMETIEDV